MVNIFSKKLPPYYYFRCLVCNKKIKFTPTTRFLLICRCTNRYCYKHIFPEHHNCTYDYIGKQKEHLKEIMPVIVADKVPNRI